MLNLLFVCFLLIFSTCKDRGRYGLTLVEVRGGGGEEGGEEGGRSGRILGGTQTFKRERRGYQSFLENYEGGL